MFQAQVGETTAQTLGVLPHHRDELPMPMLTTKLCCSSCFYSSLKIRLSLYKRQDLLDIEKIKRILTISKSNQVLCEL